MLPTTTYKAEDFLTAAERLQIAVVVGSEKRQVLEAVAMDRTITLDFAAPEEAARAIVEYAGRRPLTAIIPTDETTAVVAALASADLALPHNPPEAARATALKDRLRAALGRAGVPTPVSTLVPCTADPATVARQASFPCVLKPTFLAASRGVIRADDASQFVAAFERIRRLLARPEISELGKGAAAHILVEEFIPGREVAVEGLLVRGRLRILALFDKPDPLDGPFFEETIYVTPSRLPDRTQELIVRTTSDATRGLGLCEGPVHAELRVNDRGVWVIEMAARSIGGLCARVLRFGAGISLEELLLQHAVGRDVSGCKRDAIPAGVMMIPIPRGGVLREVRGVARALAVNGIVGVIITARRGQPIVPLPEGASYLGFIFARGEHPERVEAALREAHGELEPVIEP